MYKAQRVTLWLVTLAVASACPVPLADGPLAS